jgi:hypothetical protein
MSVYLIMSTLIIDNNCLFFVQMVSLTRMSDEHKRRDIASNCYRKPGGGSKAKTPPQRDQEAFIVDANRRDAAHPTACHTPLCKLFVSVTLEGA